MSALYIWSGYDKLLAPAETSSYFAEIGIPLPLAAWLVAVIVELLGGLALLLGFQTRIVALVLGAWSIATAAIAHSNFADLDMQIHFMKNLAMAGGFIYIALFGAGAYALETALAARKRR